MKVRRMCGGGVRSAGLTEFRWSAVTAGPRKKYVAAINDRLGLALILHDPDNAWPRQPWPVVRKRWAWRAHGVALQARNRAADAVCSVLGHQPDPVESWCCSRCRGASGVD